MPDMVFVTNRTNIHLPATADNPDGMVFTLMPGLNQVPDIAAKDSFVLNLVKTSAEAVKQAQADAETTKKTETAAAQASQAVSEAQKAALDARTKAGEDWAKEREAAMSGGLPFSKPHPDPLVAYSIILTSEPQVYAGAGFIGKATDPNAAPSSPPHVTRVTPDTGGGSVARK
jgi:hypothetical protein